VSIYEYSPALVREGGVDTLCRARAGERQRDLDSNAGAPVRRQGDSRGADEIPDKRPPPWGITETKASAPSPTHPDAEFTDPLRQGNQPISTEQNRRAGVFLFVFLGGARRGERRADLFMVAGCYYFLISRRRSGLVVEGGEQ